MFDQLASTKNPSRPSFSAWHLLACQRSDWGLTPAGTFFQTDSNCQNHTVIVDGFGGTNGESPYYTNRLLATDGQRYGLTRRGGSRR
ncbi:MAG: hypothetical protein AAGN35_04795 [Bacteroidota bacterium]